MDLTFDKLKATLDQYGFTHTDMPKSAQLPFDQLFISLGADDKERPWILNLRLFEQGFEGDVSTLAEGTPTRMLFLNFLVTFPFSVVESAFGDISRLILMLNKILPVPGFGLSEPDHVVYYQYTLVSVDGKLDTDGFLTLIGLIVHYMQTHQQTLEEVATLEKSLQTVLIESAEAVERLAKE